MELLRIVLMNVLHRRGRSFLTTAGVAAAICVMVTLVGIADSLKASYGRIFEARGVDMIVTRAGALEKYKSTLPEFLGEDIGKVRGVRKVSPALIDMIEFSESNLPLVPVQGWARDSFAFNGIHLVEGRRMAPGESRGAILGGILARNLHKKPDGTVKVMDEDFVVTGVFESPVAFENGTLVIYLDDLQSISGRSGQVTGFQVVLQDGPEKDVLAREVRTQIEALRDARGRDQHLVALPIQDHVANMYQLRLSTAAAWATSAVALLIGTVGVLNIMLLSVFERTQELGILRAIGWGRGLIVCMILMESILLSLAGSAAGAVGAFGLTFVLNRVPALSGYIQPGVSPVVVAEGFLLSLLMGLCGGFLPAIRTTWLLPAEALRHV
jgi:putative ABC transport system permease protein